MEIMHKGMWTGRRVLYLSVDAIRANPDQPRKYFEPEALRELAESIGRYGILQPLTVRRGGGRLRADRGRAAAAGGEARGSAGGAVPRGAVGRGGVGAALADRKFAAAGPALHGGGRRIAKLIAVYGLSQEQAAERLGKSRARWPNKLRLRGSRLRV